MLRQFARNLFAFSLTSLLISRANAFAYYDFVYSLYGDAACTPAQVIKSGTAETFWGSSGTCQSAKAISSTAAKGLRISGPYEREEKYRKKREGFLLWFCADDKCVDKCTSVEWGRNPICDANDPLGWSVAVPGTTQNLASNGDNTFGSFMLVTYRSAHATEIDWNCKV